MTAMSNGCAGIRSPTGDIYTASPLSSKIETPTDSQDQRLPTVGSAAGTRKQPALGRDLQPDIRPSARLRDKQMKLFDRVVIACDNTSGMLVIATSVRAVLESYGLRVDFHRLVHTIT